jgi:uncharacterized protein YjbJ (UPF0337 family)
MNRNVIEGAWRQLKGAATSRWATLTNDDGLRLRAERERLVGRFQSRYGILRDEAQLRANHWLDRIDSRPRPVRDL